MSREIFEVRTTGHGEIEILDMEECETTTYSLEQATELHGKLAGAMEAARAIREKISKDPFERWWALWSGFGCLGSVGVSKLHAKSIWEAATEAARNPNQSGE